MRIEKYELNSEKCKLKNRNFKRSESKDEMHLRIRYDSSKMSKCRKQKNPKEIKVGEHFERRCSKPCATDEKLLGKGEAGGKADRGQERKRCQPNWKNMGEVTRTVI